MFCKYCGTRASAAGFCTRCGQALAVPAGQTPTPTAQPQQTAQPATTATGTPVRPRKTAAHKDPRQRGGPMRFVSLIGVVVLLVGATGAAVWWLTGDGDNTETGASAEVDASYGSDEALDALWDRCESGGLAACDELYFAAPVDSGYERFGATCGNREAQPGLCSAHGGAGDTTEGGFGSDPQLDLLYMECEEGNMLACDDLFFEAEPASAYEEFGATCGLRGEGNGDCVSIF